MKYNSKYDRYVTKDGLVYRYDYRQDKLVLCKIQDNGCGYKRVFCKNKEPIYVHRLVYETFKGAIPDGMEIDHEDTNKDNNSIDNLILCSHKENCNNPKTKKNRSKAMKGNKNPLGSILSDFGQKYFEHFGYTRTENTKQYNTECSWYHRHNNTCRWEV